MRTCGPTEALVWIDERAGAGETVTASQLFCNRALCLLKLEPIRAAEALEDCNAAVVSPHLRRPLSLGGSTHAHGPVSMLGVRL